MTNVLQLKGIVQLIEDTKVILELSNKIMLAPFQAVCELLLDGTAPDIALQYAAVGSGTTTVEDSDTQLASESARIIYTNRYRSGLEIISEYIFTKAEANGTIAEIGFFVGPATSAANSGTLWSRVLVSPAYTKTSDKELTIRRIDQWSKA